MAADSVDYWNNRARAQKTFYKGEEFYTVTEVPFYYQRRRLLLSSLAALVEECGAAKGLKVLDFGCGDGFFSLYLASRFPAVSVYGCDLSAQFISDAKMRAEQKGVGCVFHQGDSVIPFEYTFDIIVCIAVLAHIAEPEIEPIVEQFQGGLRGGGKVLLFEQTATVPRHGQRFARRTEDYYMDLFAVKGFRLVSRQLIAFPFFTGMSRYSRRALSLAAALVRRLRQERLAAWMCNPNNSLLLTVRYWEVMLAVSRVLDRFLTPAEGNTVFIFEKDQW